MKTPVVVAAVVALHVLVIGGALLIGGCKSLPPTMQPKPAPPPPPPVVVAPPSPPAPIPPLPAPAAEHTYTVKKGDTLSKIAKSEGVSLSALLAANNLTVKSVIHPGQTLTISAGKAGEITSTGTSYTVKAGDSLSKIAKAHGTSVDALIEANHLKSEVIRVGQTLKIPTAEQTSKARHHQPKHTHAAVHKTTVTAEGGKYTVQQGDTLGSIAKKLGVKTGDLMTANNISDPKKLRVGQILTIPGKEAAAPPAVLPGAPPPPPETSPGDVKHGTSPQSPPPAETKTPDGGTTTPPATTPPPPPQP